MWYPRRKIKQTIIVCNLINIQKSLINDVCTLSICLIFKLLINNQFYISVFFARMGSKSPNVRNMKFFPIIADIMLLILVDIINYRAHALEMKAEIFRGFTVTPIGSKSNVIEEKTLSVRDCYSHLFEDLCTAITYNELEKKCLKHYYGRILIEQADSTRVTWIRSMLH